jgi:hypothetical protein
MKSIKTIVSIFLGSFFFVLIISWIAKSNSIKNLVKTNNVAQEYKGTASITQGLGKLIKERIFTCERGRKTDIGTITSTDGKQWDLPAKNHFLDIKFPWSSDLFNVCNGNTFANVNEAISKLDGSDIIEVDKDGSVFTAFVFADNYFEMYINGKPVDKVPFTEFNSSIVRFKVKKPFTIAMKLVDWEENLGLGSEANRGTSYHPGDGGMVAVVKDENNKVVAITNKDWKAQTYYVAPIKDLSCVTEEGQIRGSKNCDMADSNDGSAYYGLHWDLPVGWEKQTFDDSKWPNAFTYTNKIIGVDNKKAYTNFTAIFDDVKNDAEFIWSSNVVLDNEVLVRYTVK